MKYVLGEMKYASTKVTSNLWHTKFVVANAVRSSISIARVCNQRRTEEVTIDIILNIIGKTVEFKLNFSKLMQIKMIVANINE